MARWTKLGLIAGGGDLPVTLAEHCAETGQPYWVARMAPFADNALKTHPGADFSLGEMGARNQALKKAGCDAIVFAGIVRRPDFTTMVFDERARESLPRILAAARQGDDALLRALVEEHERDGLKVIGVEEVVADLLAPAGVLGAHAPNESHRSDIAKAAAVAAALGAWDVGQAVAVCDGLVLAVEAQEGTDGLLARVASMPAALRGGADKRRGVLVKRPKPQQERRIDLPTIGVATIEGAAKAGLAGVAVEAGGALILHRGETIARADELGLFVYGFDPASP